VTLAEARRLEPSRWIQPWLMGRRPFIRVVLSFDRWSPPTLVGRPANGD
jgi:hypothetical protein